MLQKTQHKCINTITGVNNENLPYSLQIIGNFGEDEKLLQISKMIVKNLNISKIQNEWDLN